MEEKYIELIKQGRIFIYPTDTIYGIGCDATNSDAVGKIREIKKRDSKPFSVIAPGKKWILENCVVNNNVEKWLNKLPGPYTLILELKNRSAVCSEVNSGRESIGVRIPDNSFSEIVELSGRPFVTTSVNVSGEDFATSIGNVNEEIKSKVDVIIDSGDLKGKPSTVVNLLGDKEEVIER